MPKPRCLTRLVNNGHDLRDTIAAERLILCGVLGARRIIRVTRKGEHLTMPCLHFSNDLFFQSSGKSSPILN